MAKSEKHLKIVGRISKEKGECKSKWMKWEKKKRPKKNGNFINTY